MDNKQILGALAMDLKRAALCIHRNSLVSAEIFLVEARKRSSEVKRQELKPYMLRLLDEVEHLFQEYSDQRGEDALMYSTRIQNYVLSL